MSGVGPSDSVRAEPVELGRSLSSLLIALYEDRLSWPNVSFPESPSFTWGDIELPLEGELRPTEDGLDLVLTDPSLIRNERFTRFKRTTYQPANIKFTDGSTLSAEAAILTRVSTTSDKRGHRREHVVSLYSWTWQPNSPKHLWVARVDGRRQRASNLTVRTARTTAACGIRAELTYDHHVIRTRAGHFFLVVDTRGASLDQSLLGHDVQALEFAIGRPLGAGMFLAFEQDHRLVGAADPEFATHPSGTATRCPVPGAEPYERACWIPAFAAVIARTLNEETSEDAPCRVAATAYLDSLSGHVHKKYLIAQVALEAVADKVGPPKESRILVKSKKSWRAFVAQAKSAIDTQATDKQAAMILLKRLQSAIGPATGRRIATALTHYGLTVPAEAIKELVKRNSVAHDFVMFEGEMPDGDELVKRLAIVQTLLVALVAKHVGYTGPIAGWDLDESRRPKVPDWWPHQPSPESDRIYVATETPNHVDVESDLSPPTY